jgi:hypothetical protein
MIVQREPGNDLVREHFNKAERTISCPVNKHLLLFILISTLNCLEGRVHRQTDANGAACCTKYDIGTKWREQYTQPNLKIPLRKTIVSLNPKVENIHMIRN